METALSACGGGLADANKLRHVPGKAQHRLDDVVKKIGSQEGAFQAIVDRTKAALHKAGKASGRFETDVVSSGKRVRVRGGVASGEALIGTAFLL